MRLVQKRVFCTMAMVWSGLSGVQVSSWCISSTSIEVSWCSTLHQKWPSVISCLQRSHDKRVTAHVHRAQRSLAEMGHYYCKHCNQVLSNTLFYQHKRMIVYQRNGLQLVLLTWVRSWTSFWYCFLSHWLWEQIRGFRGPVWSWRFFSYYGSFHGSTR